MSTNWNSRFRAVLAAAASAHPYRRAGVDVPGRDPALLVVYLDDLHRTNRWLDGIRLTIRALDLPGTARWSSWCDRGHRLAASAPARAGLGAGVCRGRHYLKVFVRRLHRKLDDDTERPHYIHTEWGIGYRFASPR